jgi:hypothetical protein
MVDWICFLIEREQKFVREPKPNDVCRALRASVDVSDSKLVAPYYWVARTLCTSQEICSKNVLSHKYSRLDYFVKISSHESDKNARILTIASIT